MEEFTKMHNTRHTYLLDLNVVGADLISLPYWAGKMDQGEGGGVYSSTCEEVVGVDLGAGLSALEADEVLAPLACKVQLKTITYRR